MLFGEYIYKINLLIRTYMHPFICIEPLTSLSILVVSKFISWIADRVAARITFPNLFEEAVWTDGSNIYQIRSGKCWSFPMQLYQSKTSNVKLSTLYYRFIFFSFHLQQILDEESIHNLHVSKLCYESVNAIHFFFFVDPSLCISSLIMFGPILWSS